MSAGGVVYREDGSSHFGHDTAFNRARSVGQRMDEGQSRGQLLLLPLKQEKG